MGDEEPADTGITHVPLDARIDQALENAPVMFIDGAVGMGISGGIVRFNLFQDRVTADPSGKDAATFITRMVCARMIMTAKVAHELGTWLLKAVEKKSSEDTGGE